MVVLTTILRYTWNAKTVNEIETIEICCFLPKISRIQM